MPSTTAVKGASPVTAAFDWVKSRLANIDIFDEHYQLEAKTNPFYALGPIFYLVWFIVMVTGCVLIIWYIPTKAAAFDSILDIQNKIPLGGIVRGMHKYGADAMIIAATMRMFRMFLLADYKPGKEFNIAIGLISLLLSMYSGLTGYLLIWNQRAFWATKVFATFPTYMDQFPVMGDFYLPLVKSMHMGWNTAEVLLGGGAAITQETITRFFSLHLAFSLIPLIFVELYFYKNAYVRIPLNWTKRGVIIFMLVIVSVILPAAQGHRSNPDVTPLPILSDWYFLGLYQMYKYLEPVVATEITLVIPITVVLLPFLDTWITGPEKEMLKRPFIFMISVMALVCWVLFSYLIIINVANIHNDPPYWRAFLYLMVDAGIIWQLWLIWFTKDMQWKAKQARAALILGIVAFIQTFWAWVYFYMAKTEMFFGPLSQAFTYMVMRPLVNGDHANRGEQAIRMLVPPTGKNIVNREFWDYHTLLEPSYIAKIGEPAGKEHLQTLLDVSQQPTMWDFIFKLIPTFTPAPHAQYFGFYDYMINNRWMFDYVTFVDRMGWNPDPNMRVAPYPIAVPELDWLWMIGGAVTTAAAAYTWWMVKQMPQTKPAAAPAAPAADAAPAT